MYFKKWDNDSSKYSGWCRIAKVNRGETTHNKYWQIICDKYKPKNAHKFEMCQVVVDT